jgi:hypothetical protein
MFIALPSPEPPKPRRGEMHAPPRNSISPLRGLECCTGRGYKHGAPTELELNGACLS